jgi:hypothetical protein
MTYLTLLNRLVLLGLLLVPALVEAATSAGEIARITGDSIAQARATDGSLRKLVAGDAIYSGDAISTGKDTTLDILFADGSRFAVGTQAEFVVDRFVYKHGAEGDAFHSRIIKGVFRFVSGLIAKSKGRDMKVSVSVATIGIRGTQVEGEVSERHEKDGVSVDASAKVVLLEAEEKGKETSIVVSNEFGSVVIDQPGYGTEIPDEKSPPSPVRKMQLHTVDNVLRALRSSVRRGGTPKPRMP